MSNRSSINISPSGTLIVVSGPSGAGKTTLVTRVREYFEGLGNPLHFSVSHTTREPRAGEHDGVDYHFVTRDAFLQMANHREFIEWANVHGHMYGTSVREVETRLGGGHDVILARIRGRGLNTEEQIQMRLAEARREVEHGIQFYDYVIINDDVEIAADCLKAAIIARKLQSSGAKRTISELAYRFGEDKSGPST